MRVWIRSLAARLALFVIALPASAQVLGSIAGTVRDSSGAVLPGASVEASSDALIEKMRVVVADGAGQYRIVNLPPGIYSVGFTLTGFSTVKRGGVEVTPGKTVPINVELKVGEGAETVTV